RFSSRRMLAPPLRMAKKTNRPPPDNRTTIMPTREQMNCSLLFVPWFRDFELGELPLVHLGGTIFQQDPPFPSRTLLLVGEDRVCLLRFNAPNNFKRLAIVR